MRKQSWMQGLWWMRTVFLFAALFSFAGCGGKGTGTVTGTVTYREKPLEGFITFLSEESKSAIRGKSDKEGKYRLEKVPVGKCKIAIQAQESTKFPDYASPEKIAEMKGKPLAPTTANRSASGPIPPQYGDTEKSGLTYTVTSGTQEYNIPLK